MDLGFTYQVQFAALDPATGDDVSGVVVSSAQLLVTQLTADAAAALVSGPFMLVPGPGA
jgi:hypothetical protein